MASQTSSRSVGCLDVGVCLLFCWVICAQCFRPDHDLLQTATVTVSIAVYSILCKIFPDSESYVSRAILADDVDIPGYTSTTINREGSSSPQLALDDNEKDTINKDKGNGSAVRVQAV